MERKSIAEPLPPDTVDDIRRGEEEEVEEVEDEGSDEVGGKVLWPLFGSPTLATIRVISYTVKGSTLCFTVQPTLEGFQWTVERTFEEFAHLHKTLVSRYGLDKSLLPTRKLLTYFSSPKPQYLSDLQLKLDKLLKTVLETFPVPPGEVLHFCGYPFCDVLSITQALTVYVYEQGDYVLSNNKALIMSPLQLHAVGRRRTLPIASTGTVAVKGEFGNLLDFLMQLRKLKVAPSTEDPFTLSPREDVSFDLSFFKSLTYLMVDSIDIVNLQGRQALTGQLEGLDIRRSLDSLKEILVVYPVDSVNVNSVGTIDLTRALKWTSLTRICFKLNNISHIDQSLQLLPALESLDLTYNLIERIENLSELPNLKVVDLSYNKVSDVSDLHLAIGKVSKLGLSHNLLTSLKGFSKCTSLMYLDLTSNQIAEVSGVENLSGLSSLEQLFLQNNPINQSPSYRSTVFSYLSFIAKQVVLDGKAVTSDELELSLSLAGVKGHKRVTSRTVDIKPDGYSSTDHQNAQEELEVTAGVASRLEEMRKTGGDKWLSLLNSDKSRTPGSPRLDGAYHQSGQADEVAIRGKERKRRHRKHQHNSDSQSETCSVAEDRVVTESAPVVSVNQHPPATKGEEEVVEEPSRELQNLIRQLDSERLHLSDFPVTVLEYSGSLESLSGHDVDQKLVNSRMEECIVLVDTTVCRLVETVLSTSRTRCQRDLALLEDIRLHEGRKRGVCLRFTQFGGGSLWIIYCLRDNESLARLYVAIQQALKTKESSKPAPPEIIEPPPNADINEVEKIPDTNTEFSVSQIQPSPPREPKHTPVSSPPANQIEESGAWKVEFAFLADTSTTSPPQSSPGKVTLGPLSPVKPKSHSRSPSPQPVGNSDQDSSGSKTIQLAKSLRSTTMSKVSNAKEAISARLSASVKLGPSSIRNKSPSPSPSNSPSRSPHSFHPVEPSADVLKSYTPPLTRPHRSGAILEVSQKEEPVVKEAPGVPDSSDLDQTSRHNKTPVSLVLDSTQKDLKKLSKLVISGQKIVKKPGIEKEYVVSFFGKIAREQKEVLLYVMWGGASLTSTPGLEIEVGLFVSNNGLYLLQIVDIGEDDDLSWSSQKLPLVCSFHMYHHTLSKVKMGIFDQSITFECVEKGLLKNLVVYSRTSENTLTFLDYLKAGLDSLRISHSVTTFHESVLKSGEDSVLFVNPDVSDMQKLKEGLVQPAVIAQLCSHKMAGYYTTTGAPTFAEEMKRGCRDLASKFEVLQYVSVSELSSDLLPISNGSVHFRPHVLVLTNDTLYLCKDDTALWPGSPDSPIIPPFTRCAVLDSCPVRSIKDIEMCERAQSVVSLSDPVYEFRISFSVGEMQGTVGGYGEFRRWQLCVYDRQYIDQLFSCLQLLWRDIHSSSLPLSHTTEPLTTVPLTPTTPVDRKHSRSFSEKPDIAMYKPTFFNSQPLVKLARLSSSERVRLFKESVSEGQFLNSDEVPMAVFLAFISTSQGGKGPVQIEVVVMASQYAIYLLTDVNNISKWLDGGGAASFSRMSLLNKQNADKARCFLRLWIREIREIEMGFFYLSLRIKTTESAKDFCIHTQDSASILALLSALSTGANIRNTREDKIMDELLSEYIDLGADSVSGRGKQVKGSKTNIEFTDVSKAALDTLKQILLCISPSITKSTTIDQSTSSLQILLGQVMIMVEEINIRGVHTINYHPHLVLLSNYGLFLCANSAGEDSSPAVVDTSDLKVKRWCHVDLIQNVQLLSNHPHSVQYASHVFCINIDSQRGTDGHTLVLAAQNEQQLRQFIYQLSLVWRERNEKNMPVYTRV